MYGTIMAMLDEQLDSYSNMTLEERIHEQMKQAENQSGRTSAKDLQINKNKSLN